MLASGSSKTLGLPVRVDSHRVDQRSSSPANIMGNRFTTLPASFVTRVAGRKLSPSGEVEQSRSDLWLSQGSGSVVSWRTHTSETSEPVREANGRWSCSLGLLTPAAFTAGPNAVAPGARDAT